MKKLTTLSTVFLILFAMDANAQDKVETEKYGNTLNLGAGIGYYGSVGHSLPVGMLNYEFDVARNFTLAPFIGFYTYQNHYYWGNPKESNNGPSYRYYSYRAMVVPVGVKGTYYFDQLFKANPKWDFYASGSLGFAFRSVTWESDYYGDKRVYQSASPLYLDAHIGAEYHMTSKAGLFLDLSTGVSTFGLALHF